jgi:hypothetical protein
MDRLLGEATTAGGEHLRKGFSEEANKNLEINFFWQLPV